MQNTVARGADKEVNESGDIDKEVNEVRALSASTLGCPTVENVSVHVKRVAGEQWKNSSIVIKGKWASISAPLKALKKSEKTYFLRTETDSSATDRVTSYFSSTASALDPDATTFHSPCLKRHIIIRKKVTASPTSVIAAPKANGDSYQFDIEVWSDRCELERVVEGKRLKKIHGDIYLSGPLSSLQWSKDSSLFLYVAERYRGERSSANKRGTEYGGEHSCEDDERDVRFVHVGWASPEPKEKNIGDRLFTSVDAVDSRHYESWGEQMENQHRSVLVVLDVDSGRLTVYQGGDKFTFGGAQWVSRTPSLGRSGRVRTMPADPTVHVLVLPEQRTTEPSADFDNNKNPSRENHNVHNIVCVMYETVPYRLGLVYCTNRASEIWMFRHQHSEESTTQSTSTGSGPPATLFPWCAIRKKSDHQKSISFRSVRVSPDGFSIVWLQRQAGGPHHMSSSIMLYALGETCVRTLLENVEMSRDPMLRKTPTQTSAVLSSSHSPHSPVSQGSMFMGLYTDELPVQPWLNGGRELCFSTPRYTFLIPTFVDVENGDVYTLPLCDGVTVLAADPSLRPVGCQWNSEVHRREESKTSAASVTRYDERRQHNGGAVVGVTSSISTPQRLVVLLPGDSGFMYIDAQGREYIHGSNELSYTAYQNGQNLQVIKKSTNSHFTLHLSMVNSRADPQKPLSTANSRGTTEPPPITAIFHCTTPGGMAVSPSTTSVRRVEGGIEKAPLLVIPHGGPHSVFVDTWSPQCAFLAAMGFGVLMINYTGSVGCGDEGVNGLLSHIGDLDVGDCEYVVQTLLAHTLGQMTMIPQIDPQRIGVYGGSHGGFIATHLIAKFPQRYRVAVVRNPVTSLTLMSEMSDIIDWCFVETQHPNVLFRISEPQFENFHSSQMSVAKMLEMSPISKVTKVTAPTLLLVGLDDLRVPPSQSFIYYKKLKAGGVPCDIRCYRDDHRLGKAENHNDVMEKVAGWFMMHLLDNDVGPRLYRR